MRKQIDRIKLGFMLSMVPTLVRRAARRQTPQRARLYELLGEAPFVFQVRTHDGAAGWFELRDGALQFHRGVHVRPDFSQTWRSASDAVKVLASRDESAMLRSLEDGSCRLGGRFAVALWFNEAMKLARPGQFDRH
ncbi:hypothetical protein [Paraburkholderia sp. HP33-1]|uniref:hypothetical protein n=1 Tax=Paraburkholderia sp. HP33-1 TaxID=2883243 RepID=UPI001F3F0489|nr:hypothetical protein [Paraburkholderia sp. HP33-1]